MQYIFKYVGTIIYIYIYISVDILVLPVRPNPFDGSSARRNGVSCFLLQECWTDPALLPASPCGESYAPCARLMGASLCGKSDASCVKLERVLPYINVYRINDNITYGY